MNSPLLIVGASVRAAAESASRAGFQPFAIDLFNDVDLKRIAKCRLSTNYPYDLPALAADFPPMPMLYTGALENYPDIITELSKTHNLLGNTAERIQKLRDPIQLRDLLESHSFPATELREADDPPGNFFGWLIKPYQSGHGLQIRPASENIHPEREYYQRLVSGISVGALFLANGTECRLIGLHQQFTGLHPDPKQSFLFSGAMAPYVLPERATQTIVEIGQLLCRTTGLMGLFGCDFILRDVPYLLEVNPRYTTATELWERLLNRSLVDDHVTACREGKLPEREKTIDRDCPSLLKLILYAPQTTQVASKLAHCVEDILEAQLADLPTEGHQIDTGDPVCTLLVEGQSSEHCLDGLNLAWGRIAASCRWDPGFSKSMLKKTAERIALKYP